MKLINFMPTKSTQGERQKQKQALSAQQKIPVKAVHSDFFLTNDNRLVRVLEVSAVNMQLMSDEELEEMFEEYEVFLKSLSFPIQQQIISQPVDLKVYIDSQTSLFSKTSNDKRKELLASYIDYSKQIETSNQIMQRKRYIVFSVPVKQQTNKAFEIAKKTAFTNENHIVNGLLSLKLIARPLNNLQLLRLLHVLFDYETAQLSPIQSDTIKEIITGGKEG